MSPNIDDQEDFMRWFYGGTPPAEDQKYIHRVIIMGVHTDATDKAFGAAGAAQTGCGGCVHRLADLANNTGARHSRGRP